MALSETSFQSKIFILEDDGENEINKVFIAKLPTRV